MIVVFFIFNSQSIANGYKKFSLKKRFNRTHLLHSFISWFFLLKFMQQIYFEHVSVLNIRPIRSLFFMLIVICNFTFVDFLKFLFLFLCFRLNRFRPMLYWFSDLILRRLMSERIFCARVSKFCG